jgi:hypothetical protein
MITQEQIQKLSERKNVKKIAVENFLTTLTGDKSVDYYNCQRDSKLYKWNAATVNAINKGI